ncbi:MAG: hypothetical protein CL763_06820 [Chloroflexi bacterium]|nr:hypothetical protein [Chloroflexota bacterium]|tara:strand:+ start:583 stop:1320 length:738 start_codon:yes stop_codon:yes gene_type:complete
MNTMSKNLAIIPARAGSKGIRNKNLQKVGSKNLIEHAITTALSSKLLNSTIVTSDHPQILSIATDYGVYARNRPEHMATDEAPVVICLQDAVQTIENELNTVYDNIVLLQPTSPIRTGMDIDNVIDMLNQEHAIEGVVSVCECGVYLPDHQYTIEYNEDTQQSYLIPYKGVFYSERLRRQEIRHSFIRNGAIYAARRNILMEQGKIIVDNKVPYLMPKKYLCNLDDHEDLALARILVPAWENGNL